MSYLSFLKKFLLAKTFRLILLVAFLIFGLSLISLAAINYHKTILGLTLGGLKAGGIDQDNLRQWLTGQIAKFNSQKISLVYEEKIWTFAPADFGFDINIDKTAAAALTFGRGQILDALKKQVRTLLEGQDLPLDHSINFQKLNRTLDLLAEIETPAKNSLLKYDSQKNDFIISSAQSGFVIDRDKLMADILKAFGAPPQTVYLSLTEAKPLVTEKEMEQIAEQAEGLINGAPYFLQSANATWGVDKTDLADWISALPNNGDPVKIKLTLDTEKIKDFLSPLAVSINREPIDAKLTSANGELKFAALSQDGQRLNLETSAAKIAEDILTNKKNSYLIIDSIAPQISNQNTKELGLLTLLGRGESNFSGSPANRRINIKIGSTKLNGFLIKPNAEFSFSRNIGDINAPNGWVPELVIKNNQNIPEFGGGLCQVSTTLFRAAVAAGLKIIERHPHAYPVHYYDPPGFDATVYPPNPDFKFINDTPGHLLLQNKIEGNKLIFEIYGSSDGRQVKIKGPTITQKNPDGSLKTILTQEIWRDGQLIKTNIFRSSYKSPDLFPITKPTPTPTPSSAEATEGAPTPSPPPVIDFLRKF